MNKLRSPRRTTLNRDKVCADYAYLLIKRSPEDVV